MGLLPWLPLLLGLVLRLVNLSAPILGVHSWRQADTAGLARNFHNQQLPIWLPQVDWGGAGPGFAETDFPIYSYAVSLLYNVFGVHEWLARALSLLCSLGALWLIQRLGQRLLGREAGWWGALFFAVLPLSVYYGRTVQPEALLLLCSALALERGLAWGQSGRRQDLALVGLGLGGAALIKVLPLFWLGVPLLWIAWCRYGPRIWRQPGLWLMALLVLAATAGWYSHAHQLYLQTGLSFGFWGAKAARYSWTELLSLSYWGDILLRTSVRGLAVLGLPLLLLGLALPRRKPEEWLLPLGLGAVLLAGAVAPSSSHIHEYYQLPLLLFACPLLGKGWVQLWRAAKPRGQLLLRLGLGLLLLTSLTVLSLDYWAKENPLGNPTWALAQRVQRETPAGKPVLSVTGGDPTLLYLSGRKGWLQQPEGPSAPLLAELAHQGASAVVGSWDWIENYNPFPDGPVKTQLRQLLNAGINTTAKTKPDYVVPLPLAGQGPKAP